MSLKQVVSLDFEDFHAGGARKEGFVRGVGEALADIGFFALRNHGIDKQATNNAYAQAKAFFQNESDTKKKCTRKGAAGQRGFTSFGTEHAKDSQAPDLKEFYQVGRTDVDDDHPVHLPYGPNIWPDEDVPGFRPAMVGMYEGLDRIGRDILVACALYLGESPETFSSMVTESDTILRVIHYPRIEGEVPAGSVRAAAHEDINLITLLSGATADGLELLTREGTWFPVVAEHDELVIDSGDMMQNLTNGLFKSTTHRVVNTDGCTTTRYSMPCFIHPRREVDLSPLESCIGRTGGVAQFPKITAGEYLGKRLSEIGLD